MTIASSSTSISIALGHERSDQFLSSRSVQVLIHDAIEHRSRFLGEKPILLVRLGVELSPLLPFRQIFIQLGLEIPLHLGFGLVRTILVEMVAI